MRPPTPDEPQQIARDYFFELTAEEAAEYAERVEAGPARYQALDALSADQDEPRTTADRDPGRPAREGESSVNGWTWRCSIKERDEGPLHGRTVAVKDNTLVAGHSLECGHFLPEELPEHVATELLAFIPESHP